MYARILDRFIASLGKLRSKNNNPTGKDFQ